MRITEINEKRKKLNLKNNKKLKKNIISLVVLVPVSKFSLHTHTVNKLDSSDNVVVLIV